MAYRCNPWPTSAWLISHASRTFVALTQIQNYIPMAVKLPSDVKDANDRGQLQNELEFVHFREVVAAFK